MYKALWLTMWRCPGASDRGAKMLASRVPPCLYRCALLHQAYGPQPRQATTLVRKIPVSPFTLGDPGAHMVVGHGIRIPWLTYRRNLRINPERFPKALHQIDGYLGVGEISHGHECCTHIPKYKLALASSRRTKKHPN